LKKGPKRVRKLWKDESKKRLRRQPATGSWSVHQVVAHLCDAEVMFGARLRFIAAMDRPGIAGWDENLFAARLPHEAASTAELHEGWAALRAMNLALLERLAPEAWSRVGVHSERGDESLSKLVHLHAAHDLVHEAQIKRALAARKPAGESKSAKQGDGKQLRSKDQPTEQGTAPDTVQAEGRKRAKKELKRALKEAEKVARKAAKEAKRSEPAKPAKQAKGAKQENPEPVGAKG
jgi:uncharacterized damage-inducible protein DinB